jgi:mRNA interferase MazF
MVRIEPATGNGLAKPSAADAFQVRSVSELRFVRRLGRLSESDMSEVGRALTIALGIAGA